jgi:hypothetical protein
VRESFRCGVGAVVACQDRGASRVRRFVPAPRRERWAATWSQPIVWTKFGSRRTRSSGDAWP